MRAGKSFKKLLVNAKITSRGLAIIVNGRSFPIIYPDFIWQNYPRPLKEILKDNLAYSATIFLPQIFKIPSIEYQTARPISETFLFKNGIYDMPCCALADNQSSLGYVKNFFNTQYLFKENLVKTPKQLDWQWFNKRQPAAVIPFSFGKESLLTFSLAQELGLKPILVNFIEPANDFEYYHKKKLIKEFEKTTGIKVYFVNYQPGLFRYGKYWGLKTELGWGLQTTEYALLTLPFVYYFKANYLLLGNEQSCNDIFYDAEGMLTYKAGYDQHHHWTPQQTLLASLILGRKVEVASFLDPLYEIAITKILHQCYPQVGRFQMSCMADSQAAAKNRWCQHCVKCGYIYALLAAANINPATVGFTENLFDQKHQQIYQHFFHYNPKNPVYGSQEELGLAFYLAYLNGYQGESLTRFKKELFAKFHQQKQRKSLIKKYLSLTPTWVLPSGFATRALKIYQKELQCFNKF